MKTSSLKTAPIRAIDGTPGTVTYGLQYLQGNSDAYFSVTAYFKGKDRHGYRNEFGGCCHEDILAARPDLKPLVDLHLSAEDG